MPRKGENIYKRKDGRWEGRYIKGRSPQGKAIYGFVYAATYKDVRSKLAVQKIANNSCPNSDIHRNESIYLSLQFECLANEWLSYMKSRIRESSYVKYRNILNSYLLPRLGETLTSNLCSETIGNLCQELLLSGGCRSTGLSPKTVSDILSVLRSILLYGERRKNIKICDCKDISIKKETKELSVLSLQNQKTLLNFTLQNISDRNLGIIICLCTGLRIGEICALCWDDISFRERTIYVHQTMQRIQIESSPEGRKTKISITSPKSPCSVRHIPISDYLFEILQNPVFSHNGFILTGDKNKFVEPRAMENHFKRVLEQCKLTNVNFHTLRHTFATRCIEVGFDVKSLSEILGHASVAITMNRYVHPSMDLKRDNMQKLSELFAVK